MFFYTTCLVVLEWKLVYLLQQHALHYWSHTFATMFSRFSTISFSNSYSPIDDCLILRKPEDSRLRVAILSKWGHTTHLFYWLQLFASSPNENTSTKPKPMCARPNAASAPLSNPAATPTGFGKVRFHSFTCTSMGLSHIKCSIYTSPGITKWPQVEQSTCRAGSFCCLQTGWIPLLKLQTASLWPVSPSVTLLIRQLKTQIYRNRRMKT